jgi:hypothetical protein
MKSWMRALLLWLMVIAMPVQGLAASLMLFCGPSHQRMVAVVSGEPQGSVVAPAHTAPHEATQEHAMAPCHGPTVGEIADASASLHGDFSCSACAACCAVLALPTRMVLPADPETARAFAASPAALVRSHHPDGLDRPPRSVPG